MKKWSKILIGFLLLFTVLNAEIEKKPLKAAALSTFIPGGGQLYNQNYWKGGAIFILESSLIGLSVYHHLEAEKYYENYQFYLFIFFNSIMRLSFNLVDKLLLKTKIV